MLGGKTHAYVAYRCVDFFIIETYTHTEPQWLERENKNIIVLPPSAIAIKQLFCRRCCCRFLIIVVSTTSIQRIVVMPLPTLSCPPCDYEYRLFLQSIRLIFVVVVCFAYCLFFSFCFFFFFFFLAVCRSLCACCFASVRLISLFFFFHSLSRWILIWKVHFQWSIYY